MYVAAETLECYPLIVLRWDTYFKTILCRFVRFLKMNVEDFRYDVDNTVVNLYKISMSLSLFFYKF